MANSFLDFARDLTAVTVIYHHRKEKILEKIGQMVEDEAKDVIGTYRYGWPQLAEATQAQRASLGFSPNEPLLREGDLRESISHDVNEHENYVDIGSDSEIAVYQEMGTDRIPPRSFLRLAAETKERDIVEHIGSHVHIAFADGFFLTSKHL